MLSILNRLNNPALKNIKKYESIIKKINALEAHYEKMSDSELRNMTFLFKEDLKNGKKFPQILPDAFAVVREASKRVLNMRHFDVQLMGGLALAEGNIAEMPTGEGKTLVASLPAYARALEGKGVHIITVNEYLAKRDFDQIGKIHDFLGLTIGLNLPLMDQTEKQQAYNSDITYGVGTEFGFDYLRDNMVESISQKVQRPFNFAIIDEVDSVLIDEAKTPLIIAGQTPANTELHRIASILASRFKVGEDFDFDEETKATSLTDKGIEKVEAAFGVENLYELEHQTLYHYVINAVRAHVIFKRDIDYIIEEGKILLVDMFTGRTMEGRTLSDGLHQAIEAKENLENTLENKAMSQVTIQNYFRMYPMLCGMTGTAKTQEKEFREVYNMDVVQIPTNKPRARVDMPDEVYVTADQKYKALVKEVESKHKVGQPVLIGTTSILQSEDAAGYLREANLPFQLLNAKSVEQEVHLISQAGQKGQITIATNMAGRGTDIVLGEGVAEIGGLHVIGTEKHENRRIDNQLRGRSGRQGDPGSTQFLISLEDDMFRRFAKDDIEKFKKKMSFDESGKILNKNVNELIERTQRIVEGSHFSMREYNLKLDDVINEQRKIVFDLRDRLLSGHEFTAVLKSMLKGSTEYQIFKLLPEDFTEDDIKLLKRSLEELYSQPVIIPNEKPTRKQIITLADKCVKEGLDMASDYENDENFLKIFTRASVSQIDAMWVKNLESMTHLKEGIGLRHYQQEDPMRIYQREGLELFTRNFENFRYQVVSVTLKTMRQLAARKKEEN
ncbi:accessory Sec system translocase SecA2 [Planococcus beigongshangi]|uniref:accessory Sec system translocase SecA2 n=1 Tax=Planococcus beigongshangi TaxID=2782536 RepID=UPI00193B3BF4|nr:accessory Sec system translocase SecA2 [Planococcus beigongshangi]